MTNIVGVCPECKNQIDFKKFDQIKEGIIVECNTCGMTLLIKSIKGNVAELDIVDEGK